MFMHTSSVGNSSTTMTAAGLPSPRSNTKKLKLCFAVGIKDNSGIQPAFQSEQPFTGKFRVFETRGEANTYVQSLPESVYGYTIPTRSIEPVQIRPRKLSSGGIDSALEVRFFNVAKSEILGNRSLMRIAERLRR